MSQAEFLEWAVPEYERFMHDNPVDTPSINRIDSCGHYELGNIEIVSMSSNVGNRNRLRRAKVAPVTEMKWLELKQYIEWERKQITSLSKGDEYYEGQLDLLSEIERKMEEIEKK